MAHEINVYGFMAQHATHLMTHEIEIIISHFSRPLESRSVIFMAHGIYNTPTCHGSWTLVPDISWEFHEP